ncbi:hypothetical protein CH330_00580 [candidate division WOR-3 bacterium JGI_Cruoil_03_51_56]|uniref:Uncharacterized protein n=1 Tax=candidate division WOR-3 bacterium JGI_Cruoil_03_51_56 TaxID=1973747 RepID=A0A235BY43_UNCW3|nr:MAG: hypothetical protein CH330_00580 [candidate division WOR-3 bacterium JGI_Cruoil_03_51_56]
MIVYHYTTKEAYDGIISTKQFIPSFFSTALDAVYGEGWYFTDLPPSSSDEELYQLRGQPEPERIKRYLVFDINSTLLQNTRPHVYRLALERVQESVIKLVNYYIENKVVIKFIRGGSRK